MPQALPDREIDFIRWRDSADWHEVLLPIMEIDERNLQRAFLTADPNNIAEIAWIQGKLDYIDTFKNIPARYFQRMAERERKEEDYAGRIRRAIGRLHSWAGGRG